MSSLTRTVSALCLLGGLLSLSAACAPSRAVVRGNWPDGRLESPARQAAMPVRPAVAVRPAPPEEEWLPADAAATVADLNLRGVLQPVYFDFDRSSIRRDQVPTLQSNAEWLRANPGARIIIEGHCDERGTREYNMALGERRAQAARDHLVSLGIAPTRIEVVSYGKELPAVPGSNEAAWALNRRAEFVIVAIGPR